MPYYHISFGKNWNGKLGDNDPFNSLDVVDRFCDVAVLVSVDRISPKDIIKTPQGLALLRLDTGYQNPAEIEKVFQNFKSWDDALLLTFRDPKFGRIFTTIRSYDPEKEAFRKASIGKEHTVVLNR